MEKREPCYGLVACESLRVTIERGMICFYEKETDPEPHRYFGKIKIWRRFMRPVCPGLQLAVCNKWKHSKHFWTEPCKEEMAHGQQCDVIQPEEKKRRFMQSFRGYIQTCDNQTIM